jgi:hypothetical protein
MGEQACDSDWEEDSGLREGIALLGDLEGERIGLNQAGFHPL